PVVRRPLGGDERLRTLDGGVVRTREVGGSAPELGEFGGERVEDLAARGTGRRRAAALEDGKRLLDVLGECARLQAVEERLALGVRGGPGVETLLPRGVCLGGTRRELAGVGDDVLFDREALRRVEAEHLL